MKTGRRKIILIVDDSQIWLDRLSKMLNGIECIENILTARNYEEALDRLLKSPDIIFLDIHLSGKSGIELFKFIKKNLPDPKVYMVSNSLSTMRKEVRDSLGADGYFDKSNEFQKIPEFIACN